MEYETFESQFNLRNEIFSVYNNRRYIRPMYEMSNLFLTNLNERRCNKLLLGSGDETPFQRIINNYNKFICFETGIQNYNEVTNNNRFLSENHNNFNNHNIGYFNLNNNDMLRLLNIYGENKFNLIEFQKNTYYFFDNPNMIFTMINLLKINGIFRFPLVKLRAAYINFSLRTNEDKRRYLSTQFDSYLSDNQTNFYYYYLNKYFLSLSNSIFNTRVNQDLYTLFNTHIYHQIQNYILNDTYLLSRENNICIKLSVQLKRFFNNLLTRINEQINVFLSIDQFNEIMSIHSFIKSFINNGYQVIYDLPTNINIDIMKLYNLSISTTRLINNIDNNFIIKRVNIFNYNHNNNVYHNCNLGVGVIPNGNLGVGVGVIPNGNLGVGVGVIPNPNNTLRNNLNNRPKKRRKIGAR